jgi:hypothetical protein
MAKYRIVEWDKRYEVDDHGGIWTPGDAKRAGPLTYIRHKVHGKSQGTGWRRLIQVAGKRRAPAVFGIFAKLLEVAGDTPLQYRGIIQDDTECPLSFILGLDKRDIEFAISVLLTIGWIEVDDVDSRNPRESPEIPGIPRNPKSDQSRSVHPPIAPQQGGDTHDEPVTLEEQNLELARKLYPGKKRGFRVEFQNFCKHHKDWRELLDDNGLKCCVQTLIDRQAYSPGFWPHFQTFCNQARYEEALQPAEVRT